MQQFFFLFSLLGLLSPIGAVVQQKLKLVGKGRQSEGDPGVHGKVEQHSLLSKLLRNYNKEAIPERPLVIHMDVLLIKVKSTIEKEGIFECVIALFIEWRDKRLHWNPADFDNLTVLAFDSHEVWLPDIAMTNSADHLYAISRDSRFIIRVGHNGMLKFVPTGTARTWCGVF